MSKPKPKKSGPKRQVATLEVAIVRIRAYPIFERAVDEGLKIGWTRAFKHREERLPDEMVDSILETLLQNVMGSLCEVASFSEDSDDSE